MIYLAEITTPANTAKASSLKTSLRISKGLVWLIEVQIPHGTCGLCHVQIFDGKYQMFPASPGEALTGDGGVHSFDDLYLKESAPFVLDIVTWNVDTVYSHTFQVRLGMASSDLYKSRYMPSVTWKNYQSELSKARQVDQSLRDEQLRQIMNQRARE